MSVLTVNHDNFEETVLRADRPVLLDFWAPWCGPCRMFSPVVEELAQKHPELQVGKVNVDKEPELASRFGVMGIPAAFYLRSGKVVSSAVGARPYDALEAMLK